MRQPDQLRLGNVLVAQGVLSEDELVVALAEQGRTGRLLGELVVALGFASSQAVNAALAEQKGWAKVERAVPAPPSGEDSSPPARETTKLPPAADGGAEETTEEQSDADRHLVLLPAATGYQLLERDGTAPAVGTTISLSQGDESGVCYLVLKTTRAPLPGGRLRCAYLQAL